MRKIGDGYPAWMGEEIFSSFFVIPLVLRGILGICLGLAAILLPDGIFRIVLVMVFVAGGVLSLTDLMGRGKQITMWPIVYSVLMFFLGVFVFFGCFIVMKTLAVVVMTAGAWLAASGVAQLVFMNFARISEPEGGLIVPPRWGLYSALAALAFGLATVLLGALMPAKPDSGSVQFLQYPLGGMLILYGVYQFMTAAAVGSANRS